MAPTSSQKRVKNVAIYRPFIYGSASKRFDPVTHPKPDTVPADHTHSWTVFVKGLDDVDITYWVRKVQFKLHESIPNFIRTIEATPGQPFQIHETGWGEFEVAVKLYYDPVSQEKPQSFYHHLSLHPFGATEEEKEKMRQQEEIVSIVYEEQVFGEPVEAFYEVLTGGGREEGKRTSMGGKGKGREREKHRETGERTALIPLGSRPGLYFSRETEKAELTRLDGAMEKVKRMRMELVGELKDKEEELKRLKEGI